MRTPADRVDSAVSEPFGPPDLIARPLQMMTSGRYLFITDLKPPYVHVVDVASGDHTRSFGLEGEGPGDFPGTPIGVAGSTRGDTVWFYHVRSGRLSGVAVRDVPVDTLHPISTTRALPLDPGSGWAFSIDGPDPAGTLLGLKDTRSGIQVFTYSLPGDKLTLRDTLTLNDTRMEPSYLADAYSGNLCYVPGRDVWLLFHMNAGRVDVIDIQGAIRGEVPIPFRWPPHVQESTRQPGRMVFGSNLAPTRHAYVGCAVTDRFVYGLYLGHLTGDGGGRDYFDRLPPGEVQVFDQSFKLVKTFVLDHATAVLAVPPGDSVLFSVKEDDPRGPTIRKTRIP